MKTILILTGAAALVLSGCTKKDTYATQAERDAAVLAQRTENAVDRAADRTRNAVENAADATRDAARSTANAVERAADRTGDALNARYTEWRLRDNDITEDIKAGGRIVRDKTLAAGSKMATGVDNARITTTVKAKMAADPDVSALRIDADTNNGVVTLKGTAKSPAHIARAMALTLDTDGVHQVISELRIDPSAR